MNAVVQNADRASRRKLVALVALEFATLASAAVATIIFNLGWPGAIVIALIVAVFTVTLIRAGEGRAKATGNFSPAMGRYNRRMLTAGTGLCRRPVRRDLGA